MLELNDLALSNNYPQKRQVDELKVLVYESPAAMAENAALFVQEYLSQCLSDRGRATLILATGNSQIQFLENLIKSGGLDWSKITCFHLDEFLGIDKNHPGSFQKYLQQKVAAKVNLQAFHYIQGDTLEPIAECDRYTELLQSQPIDLCCLGIGTNGHLAFNEPEVANFSDPRWVKIVKLAETTLKQQVNGISFNSVAAVPNYAFTVTIPAICQSRNIVALAAGKSKADIVEYLLKKPVSPDFPATILRKQSQANLFLDLEAASFVTKSS